MEANNVKDMREALKCALAVLDGFGYAHPDCVRAAYDCKAALSKPPRNCDVLSADKCKQIFKSEMEVYLPQEVTENDREIVQRTGYGVIDALFAPYTKQKGENDADK